MTLITLIMEQNGLGAGGWVLGFPRGVQCRSRSIQIEKKSKGEVVATYPSLVTTPRLDAIRPSYPGENIQIATLLQRERRLLPNPFDRIQWASIFKFIWRRFLFLQPFLARPSFTLLSLSLALSPVNLRVLSTTKTVRCNRCELLGVGTDAGKKNLHLAHFFFTSFDRQYSCKSRTEATPTDARICTR